MRSPLPHLGEAERVRRLRERGLDANLQPLDATQQERQAMDAPTPDTAPPAAPQPAQGAVLKQPVVQVLTVVGVVAAAALAASQAGVLPAWVGAVSQAVIGVLAAVGVASPGIRKV